MRKELHRRGESRLYILANGFIRMMAEAPGLRRRACGRMWGENHLLWRSAGILRRETAGGLYSVGDQGGSSGTAGC